MVTFAAYLTILTEILLYISFSLLLGGLLIVMVPENKKPNIHVPNKLLLACTVLIPVLSFVPLWETGVILADGLPSWTILKSIILTFKVGEAWIFAFIVSIFLFVLLYMVDVRKYLAKMALFLILLLVLSQGYAGHASSITQWTGFVVHSLHFLGVIVWIGLVLIVGWFSTDQKNWQVFLKWFTPLAIISVVVLTIAGFFTMEIDIQNYNNPNASIFSEYKNSWLVNYGQSLLIKHLMIIPLLLFAFLNGFILKSKVQEDSAFKPLKWLKVESIYAVFVFTATAFMGLRYPPHQISTLIQANGPSLLFDFIYQGTVTPKMNVALHFSSPSYVLFGLTVVFGGLVILSVLKRAPAVVSIFSGLLLVFSGYLGLMLGVQ